MTMAVAKPREIEPDMAAKAILDNILADPTKVSKLKNVPTSHTDRYVGIEVLSALFGTKGYGHGDVIHRSYSEQIYLPLGIQIVADAKKGLPWDFDSETDRIFYFLQLDSAVAENLGKLVKNL